MIEQGPSNGFNDGCFASAIWAADCCDAGIEFKKRFGVVLNVLNFDFGDLQEVGTWEGDDRDAMTEVRYAERSSASRHLPSNDYTVAFCTVSGLSV